MTKNEVMDYNLKFTLLYTDAHTINATEHSDLVANCKC